MIDPDKLGPLLARAQAGEGFRYLYLDTADGVLFEVLPPQVRAPLATRAAGQRGVKLGFGGELRHDGSRWCFRLDWKRGAVSESVALKLLKVLRRGDPRDGIPKLARLAASPIEVLAGEEGSEAPPVGAPAPEAPPAPSPGARSGSAAPSARDRWLELQARLADAYDEADAGLAALGAAMIATGEPDLVDIARAKLPDLLSAGRVELLTACMDVSQARDPKARADALARVAALSGRVLDRLEDDPRIEAVDHNPAGVQVGLMTGLGGVLAEICTFAQGA